MSSPPPTTTTSPPPPTATPPPTTTVVPPQPPQPRKFPAPCWTQEETLALISAYQDKWYSLRRRNLRTADWESVAEDVTRRCPPNQTPPKTSAQCRHKMEKLRKRYRTEKQRFLSLPHNRFFSPSSSWVFFDLMEAMEAGSNGNNNPSTLNGSLKVVSEENRSVNLKGGKEEFGKYFDDILMGAAGGGSGGAGGPIKFKVKNQHHHSHPQPPYQVQNFHHRFDDLNRRNDDDEDDENYYDGGSGRIPMMAAGPGPVPIGSKRKYPGQEYDDRFDPRKIPNGIPKSGSGSGSGSRARDSVAEMVSSIKMLGEGLVRMEKMKMDMMREIEKMRMEMEMKRSEMILESQQLIVNAFVEGMKNKKKIKVMEVE